ncbi:hypothetical protein Naga_100236g5 [Nannochloropsis gaditana]|uniref:Uncharacterized protein n=1 Tax=Nannochloropsis gaditana TaxID=72520 RepID=W7TYN5_9STRA|nr:hypothetical protein Naga_100236g5 [Nannochloropsis gaditana]
MAMTVFKSHSPDPSLKSGPGGASQGETQFAAQCLKKRFRRIMHAFKAFSTNRCHTFIKGELSETYIRG